MSRVTFTWTADEWERAAVPALNRGLAAAAMVMADTAVRNLSKHKGPSPAGEPPGKDLSHLRNSIAWASPDALGTPLHAAFGTAVKYGRVHEFGAVIFAKGKKLKVPINRKLARQAERNRWPLFLVKRKGKPPLLARTLPNGAIQPIYVLVASVTIPARPWIRRSAMEALPKARELFVRVTKNELKARRMVKEPGNG